ncbi:MAG TPA: extracellular solute-binding protein, partial [Roseiflexaceae bacterium]|nr:extracellular solute-binding protein [Roseiflexaceae bacterium]
MARYTTSLRTNSFRAPAKRDVFTACLRAALLVLLALLGAACGAPASNSSAVATQPTAASTATTLTYAFPDDAASTAAAQALIAAYKQAHAGVEIVPQPLPAKEYAQQLLSRLESNPPDLFVSLDAQAPALIERGALLDLKPMLTGDITLKID